MQKIKSGLVRSLSWSVLFTALLIACDDSDNLSPEESRAKAEVAAQDNSEILAATQEVLDVTSMALIEKNDPM